MNMKKTLGKMAIKFLLGAPSPRCRAAGYYGRACTPPSGAAAKIGKTSCHKQINKYVTVYSRGKPRGIKPYGFA
jgi:hypothetical protein